MTHWLANITDLPSWTGWRTMVRLAKGDGLWTF